MKFTTNHSKFFKEWRCGSIRILNDVYGNVFCHYELQVFDGTRWSKVRSFRTLKDAKAEAEAVAANL